jgi:nucleoside recognition membrane protein YjiH
MVFCFSAVFPLSAGLSKNTASLPHWWGSVDVGTAFLLAALALSVLAIGTPRIRTPVKEATYRCYRVLVHGIFVLIVVFVFFGDHIAWSQCLSGLAWRSWLLLYVLPAWIAAYRTQN